MTLFLAHLEEISGEIQWEKIKAEWIKLTHQGKMNKNKPVSDMKLSFKFIPSGSTLSVISRSHD